MLDMKIEKGRRFQTTQKFDLSCFVKATQILVPLSPTSSHPKHIHESWPKGQMKRFRNLSTSRTDARALGRKFGSTLDIAVIGESTSTHRKKPRPYSRIVLPFHTRWASIPFTSILKRACMESGIRDELANVANTWKLLNQHVGQKILSYSTVIHEQTDTDTGFMTIWR